MPLDPLATRLEALLADGSIEASRLSARIRKRLKPLFDFNHLFEQKAGSGKRVIVRDRQALERWISREYPSGLHGTEELLPARSEAVANYRDSKGGRQLDRVLCIRGFRNARLTRTSATLPLAALTTPFTFTGVSQNLKDPWNFSGRLVLVENFELFMHVEAVVPGAEAALWTRGRLAQSTLDRIAAMPDCSILHVGDYDPVGLDEYLRLRAALAPDRVSLHVPDDLEERLVRYGKIALLEKSRAVLERVRREANAEIAPVLELMDRHGKALEQEALLIPLH